jgi:hypothetical protein
MTRRRMVVCGWANYNPMVRTTSRYRFDVESLVSLGEDASKGNHQLKGCIQQTISAQDIIEC